MRNSFMKVIEEKCRGRSDIFFLTGDLGFKLFDKIKQTIPDRFFDMGISEANMVSVAAGLSLVGKNVYCYSIIPFLVMRAFEQIRVDVACHEANVKFVGSGGGFAYGLEGISHWSLEDVALMRMIENMTVVVPADALEAERLAELSIDHKGPIYIRLGKTGGPNVYDRMPDLKIGKAITLANGSEIALISNGSMVHTSLQVAENLKNYGFRPNG